MDNLLKIDLDRKFGPCRFTKWADNAALTLHTAMQRKITDCRVMETKKGYHIYLTLNFPPTNEYEHVFLQACLSSDPRREVLNWLRIRRGQIENWNILFNRKTVYEGGQKAYESKETRRADYERIIRRSQDALLERIRVADARTKSNNGSPNYRQPFSTGRNPKERHRSLVPIDPQSSLQKPAKTTGFNDPVRPEIPQRDTSRANSPDLDETSLSEGESRAVQEAKNAQDKPPKKRNIG